MLNFFFSHRFVSQFNNFMSLMLLIPFLVLQFLSRIHIGPTQGHYSDVLPTPCTAKMNSLKPRVEYIRLYPLDQPESCSNGSPSHVGGGRPPRKHGGFSLVQVLTKGQGAFQGAEEGDTTFCTQGRTDKLTQMGQVSHLCK